MTLEDWIEFAKREELLRISGGPRQYINNRMTVSGDWTSLRELLAELKRNREDSAQRFEDGNIEVD